MVDEEVALVIQSTNFNSNSKEGGNKNNSNGGPISVLDTRRSPSPSPSTSTSTLSSSFTPNAAAAVPVNNIHQKWPEEMGISGGCDWSELQPIAMEFCLQQKRFGVGLDDWERMLSEQDHDLLRWISGDVDDTSFTLKQLLQIDENAPPTPLNSLMTVNTPPQQIQFQPPAPAEFLLNKSIQKQLFAAAELMLSGNFFHAQGILARLNHQLPSCTYNPIQRSAFLLQRSSPNANDVSNTKFKSSDTLQWHVQDVCL